MNCGSKFASVLGIAVSVLALSAPAEAVPITFAYQGTGSGTLNGQAFTNAKFTFEAVGDTDNRQHIIGNDFQIVHSAASIEIEGIGTVTFVSGTRTFVNNFTNTVGFSRGPNGSDLYHVSTDVDFDWDMLDSFDLAGAGRLLAWTRFFGGDVLTSGGVLLFDNARDFDGVFKAVVGTPPVTPPVGDVPEPAALGLLGLGLVGLGYARRRRA